MNKIADERLISSCKGCHFAHKIGNTQVGCELNKIERFKEAGAQIEEAEDDSEEFYIIDRFCSTYRDSNWGKNFSNARRQILIETSIPINMIILHRKDDSLEDLTVTLKDVAAQINKPISVSVVVQDGEINTFNIRHKVHEHLDEADIGFYIITMLNENTELEMIDEAFNKCKNGYYSVFTSGATIPKNFIERINQAVNLDLDQLSMIRPKSNLDGLTVQCFVHRFLNGNHKMSAQEKVELFAKETKRESFIKSWDEYYG